MPTDALRVAGISPEELRALSGRSDLEGFVQLVLHIAALAATGTLVALAWPSPWVLVFWVLHGIVLAFLFAPLHECTHRTAFASRRANDAVAAVCGVLLLLPARYFRAFHFAHHAHTQDPQRDPELRCPKPATLGRYLIHVCALPYWRERASTLARHACGAVDESFVPSSRIRAMVLEARAHVGLYAAMALASWWIGSPAALLYWLIPLALGQPALRLFLLAEHTLCPYSDDALVNTRTTHCNALLRRLAWNMSYHREHHLYPRIPFHALPAAHALARGFPLPYERSYIAFHRALMAAMSRD